MDFKTAVNWTTLDLRSAAWHLLVNRLAGSFCTPRIVRYLIYRLAGLDVQTPSLMPGLYFHSRRVSLGRGTFVNLGCRFYGSKAPIQVGDNVQVGMNVTFVSDSHELGPPQRRAGELVSLPVRVGNGCWIGANALILPGVDIGSGCVIAAGAVVTKSCQPNGVYAGVPARRVKDLEDVADAQSQAELLSMPISS
jgi:maltose O-acetyltransferase